MNWLKMNTSFESIGKDKLTRFNYKTSRLSSNIENVKKNIEHFKRIKDVFEIINGYAFSSDDYISSSDTKIVRIGDLNEYNLNYENMVSVPNDFYEDEKFKKYIVLKNDILVSLTGDGNIKCLLFQDDKKVLLNQRVAILRSKSPDTDVNFYYWLLQSDFNKMQFMYYSNGKSQLNISPTDLANLKLPKIDKNTQKQFVEKITPFMNNYNELLSKRESKKNIINSIFNNYFKFDVEKFEELKEVKKFNINFNRISNNVDLRFSSKFHRYAGEHVYSELKKNDYYKLKDIMKIPMITGQGISPSEYSDDSDYYYLSMADIGGWNIDYENLKGVTTNYSSSHKFKKINGVKEPQPTTLEINDIVLTRSGEGGIGKTAIMDRDCSIIFCDFIIRMRINEKLYNPLFVYYYTVTNYFQYLVEINKKGLGNNTNIFPNILNYFPIPVVEMNTQLNIVNMIDEKLNYQKKVDSKISELDLTIESMVNQLIS